MLWSSLGRARGVVSGAEVCPHRRMRTLHHYDRLSLLKPSDRTRKVYKPAS